ncbi:MAG: 4-hydroxy-tetrahydrodipicolinate synthase [Lachnospiraceae bacterium]|nr:4-hydroxy-tetrahydrodipicolinate synthase [Lachnospiraceae bacterium]
MSVFKGAAVAIVTPMFENGDVNYEKLAEIIEEQITEGTDAIVICGTTGESATMNHQEHLDVIRFCVEKVNKRVPVIAGTGSNATSEAIHLSRGAEECGADALLVVTPYYNKATQKGLINHFTTIAEAVTIPIILYNVPSRTGCNLLPETVATLVKNVKNIVGLKEATGNISQMAKTKFLCPECEIYSGNDDQTIPMMALGAEGVISVMSNVAPRYTHEMCQKFIDGDVQGAAEMQLKCLPLIDALFCQVNPIPVKVAMNVLGKEVGPLRAPLYDMEPSEKEYLRKTMEDFGLM